LAAREVTAGLPESNGTAGFMASVTCGLTAEDRDQLRNLTLVSSIGLIYLTYEKIQFRQNVISKMTKTKWLENRRPPPKTEVVTEVHELES